LNSDADVIIDELFKQCLSSFPNLNRALKTVAGSVSLATAEKAKEAKVPGSLPIPLDEWRGKRKETREG